jgi:hypothetical protein
MLTLGDLLALEDDENPVNIHALEDPEQFSTETLSFLLHRGQSPASDILPKRYTPRFCTFDIGEANVECAETTE